MLQFSCRSAFLATFRLSNWTPKIMANFDAVSGTNVPTLFRCNFFKHIPKPIIVHTQ